VDRAIEAEPGAMAKTVVRKAVNSAFDISPEPMTNSPWRFLPSPLTLLAMRTL
jgi:hypothetical protein